jgi:hypothetical protein
LSSRSGSFADAFSWVVSHGSCFAHCVIGLRPPRWFMPSLRQFGGHDLKTASAQCLLAPLQWQSYRCRARSPVVPARKEIKNDLENSKNRGSSGGDGNQHVRLRGSQIAGCDNHRIRRRWTVVATTCPKKDDCNLRTAAFCGPPPCPRSSASPHLQLRCTFLRLFSCLVLHSLAGWAL